MEILSPAARIDPAPRDSDVQRAAAYLTGPRTAEPSGTDRRPTGRCSGDAELDRLRAEVSRLTAQVTRLEAERAALWWAAGHDELTGLANRRLFRTLAAPLLDDTAPPAAVAVLDLNGFKPVNDTYGHAAGDWVLCVVASRLVCCAGDSPVARLAGDEFAAVLTSPCTEPAARWWQPAVLRLAAAIAEPVPVAGQSVSVTASIGVAPAGDRTPIGELLRRADLAMYRAKSTGRGHAAWAADATADRGPVRPGGPPAVPHHRPDDLDREPVAAA